MKRDDAVVLVSVILFLMLPSISASVLYVSPGNYSTIQAAVDNASSGDTIQVANGTYNTTSQPLIDCEGDMAMVCINKNVTIRGDPGDMSAGPGINKAIIEGDGQEASAFVFNKSASVSGGVIEGFEIRNFTNSVCNCTGGIGSGIMAWNANTSNIKICDNYLHDLGWNGILVGSDDGGIQNKWEILRNIIEDSDYAGIELTNTNESYIENNNITVGSGISWDPLDSGVGVELAIRDHGTMVSTLNNSVRKNSITSNGVTGSVAGPRAGINILSRTYTSSADTLLKNITINGNNVSNISSRGIYVVAESRNDGDAAIEGVWITDNIFDKNGDGIIIRDFVSSGSGDATHADIHILRNRITDSTGISSGIHIHTGTSALGIHAHFNDIFGNVYGVNNEGNGTLNATFNWWGSCDGPGFAGPGSGDNVSTNVTFNPWLGICIINKTNSLCPVKNNNITLFAEVFGLELETVRFSYSVDGINYNKTGVKIIGSNNTYHVTINQSFIGNYLLWNVFANDSFGGLFNNSWINLYVHNETNLTVNPVTFDGLNGWYVSEPFFSLTSDNNSLRYYQWDAGPVFPYIGAFGLDNITNAPPKESAGIVELNYWSNFSCSVEPHHNKTFFVDLTNPLIINRQPAPNSTVYNNNTPVIGAYLDEVYQSNSGINKSRVVLMLDGVSVPANVTDADSIDALVRYTPSPLSLGMHNVSVYAEDYAGRNNNVNWSFFINFTGDFNVTIYAPINGSVGVRKIMINMTVTKRVSNISFFNEQDSRPKWRVLCKQCDEYGFSRKKSIMLNEGWNNITLKTTDEFGTIKEHHYTVFIDSRPPVVLRIEPRKNAIVNGSNFSVTFYEDNLEDVMILWNPNQTVQNCTLIGKKTICMSNLNVSDFEGEFIDFYFNISDVIRTVQSKKTKVFIDTVSPLMMVNFPENKTGNESYEKNVPINISASEEVTLEYYDAFEINPRWRTLCRNCEEFGLSKFKTRSFKDGIHDVIFRAVDKAGNSDETNITFEVD